MRMLKHIFLFLLFTFIVFTVKADNIKIACVGNSITEGFGLENPSQESYPAVLQSLLGDDYEVENFGLSARTLLMKGDLPYMKEQRFKDALEFLPDIVTIKLGTKVFLLCRLHLKYTCVCLSLLKTIYGELMTV